MSNLQLVIVGATVAELFAAAQNVTAELAKMSGGVNAGPAQQPAMQQPAMQQPGAPVFSGAPAAPQMQPAPQAAPQNVTPGGVTADRIKNVFGEFVTLFGAQAGQTALGHFAFQNVNDASGAKADELFAYLVQSVQQHRPGVQF